MTRYSALFLALVVVAGCGDDETGMPAGGAGGLGGATGGVGGMTGGMGGATGGMGGATGGVGGATGGMGGMTGGVGGMTGGMGGMMDSGMPDSGMEMDEDSGMEDAEVDAGSDAAADAGDAGDNTGEEGAQNGPCGAASACDDGLGCYEPDENLPNFCTLECTEDEDCEALTGATWTCWINGGLCRVACDSGNGNADCPAGFECVPVVGQNRCVPME